MSYDLFLTPKPGKRLLKSALASYFRNRPNYRLQSNQAIYENEDTGVYFVFDLPAHDLGGFSLRRLLRKPPESIAFNLNYFRPHIYGLEAEPHLTAIVKRFDLDIHDPQNDGMADGPYSREGFLRGWNAGNRFGYHAMLNDKDSPQPIHTLPSAKIEETWAWNLARKERQRELGNGIFVPIIKFVESAGMLETVAVWTQAIPTLMPVVDSVLLMIDPAEHKLAKVPFSEVAPLIAQYEATYEQTRCFHLDYPKAPQEIESFFYLERPAPKDLVSLSPDQVHDEEIVSEARPLHGSASSPTEFT